MKLVRLIAALAFAATATANVTAFAAQDHTHATKPLYLWSLAMAYDAAGKHAEAQESAREGIALLAPVRPGERPTLTRKSFEALQMQSKPTIPRIVRTAISG